MSETSRAGGVLTLCAIAASLTIGSQSAGAEPIPLSVLSGSPFQQTDNRPCIIGDPSCHNPDSLPYTLIPSQTEKGTLVSPTYTVGQIRDLMGSDTFSVGLILTGQRSQRRSVHTEVLQPRG